jgi:predicted RNase H-like HicB family nuclease
MRASDSGPRVWLVKEMAAAMTKSMVYFGVVIEREDSGAYSAYVPGIPVYAQAETQDQVQVDIQSTLKAYVDEHPDLTPSAIMRVARVTHRPRSERLVEIVSTAALIGATPSRAKARAARVNGKLGGRPKGRRGRVPAGRPGKFTIGAVAVANAKAPADYRGRRGKVVEVGPGRNEYGVKFEGTPAKGRLMSWWLDRD